MEKIRAFIAVPVNEKVRAAVGEMESTLKQVGADVKWVEPENVHITLKFLGNVNTRHMEDLCQALRDSLSGVRHFEIMLSGSGTFPKGRRNPRVIWIGIAGGQDELAGLADRIEEACSGLGFEREDRPFKAHLTIGRVRRGSTRLVELSDRVRETEFNPLKLAVDRVNLVKSRLSPRGPAYTVLESFDLEL